MPPLRPCLVCGVPTEDSRCAAHQRQRPAYRQQYRQDRRWRNLAAEMKREQPWCSYCGATPTPENPLELDHILPASKGGAFTRANAAVACRRCNQRKSGRAAPAPPLPGQT